MGISWADVGIKDWGTPSWMKNPIATAFGDRDNVGILGTGQYRTDGSGIDQAAFYDQNAQDGIDGQLNGLMAVRATGAAPSMTAANIDKTQSNEMRARQTYLANQLLGAMDGKDPSIAEQQLNRTTNSNVNNAYSMAASARGVNPALALRNAMYTGANVNQDAAGQAALLRSQEINDARNAYGGLTTNARAQDMSIAEADARLKQDASTQNLASKVQSNSATDNTLLNAAKLRTDIANTNRQSKMDFNTLRSNEVTANNKTDQVAYADAAKGRRDTAGALGEAFGMASTVAGFFSDEKLKTKSKPNDPAIQEWLNNLTPYTYNYKADPSQANPRAGVMAQDVEKTDLGEDMVMNTPQGKAIDTNQATSALLGATAHMNQRLNSIEETIAAALKSKRKGKK